MLMRQERRVPKSGQMRLQQLQLKKVMMARHVPVMMNARVFVKGEAVAPIMAILAIQVRIVADIKAALTVNARNKECRGNGTGNEFIEYHHP